MESVALLDKWQLALEHSRDCLIRISDKTHWNGAIRKSIFSFHF